MAQKKFVVSAKSYLSREDCMEIIYEASNNKISITEAATRHGVDPAEVYRGGVPAEPKFDNGFVAVDIINDRKPVLCRVEIEFTNNITLTLAGQLPGSKLNNIIEILEAS